MFVCFAILVSLALNPKLTLVYNVKGATYAGPLTWLGRWLHLGGLSQSGRATLYVVLMFLLSATYIGAAYLVRRQNRVKFTVLIVAGIVVFSLLFLFIPPLLSRDVYSYAFHGRAMTVYGANPYLAKPLSYRQDLMYPLIGWKHNASVYGPVFNSLSAIVCLVAGDNITTNVLGFKVLAFVFLAASLLLVYMLTSLVAPGYENFALVVTGWSPILLIHIIGAGHNDAVMIFFILLGFMLYRKDRPLWGLIAVLLAAMIKSVAAIVLLPYLVLFLRDQRGKFITRAAEAAAILVILPVALYLPYWKGLAIFETTRSMLNMHSGAAVPTLTRDFVAWLLSTAGLTSAGATSIANLLIRVFFLALFIILALALLSRVKDFRSMVVSAAGISLVWFFTASYVLPWYLALGLFVTMIAGWNATSGVLIASACVFSLWRIPPIHAGLHIQPLLHRAASAGATIYLALPLTILFIAWLVSERPIARVLRSQEAGKVEDLSTPTAQVRDED